jgi:hypothetical protein
VSSFTGLSVAGDGAMKRRWGTNLSQAVKLSKQPAPPHSSFTGPRGKRENSSSNRSDLSGAGHAGIVTRARRRPKKGAHPRGVADFRERGLAAF